MSIKRHDIGKTMSKVVEHNSVVYICGLTADDESVGITGQTAQILAKIDRYLAEAGTDKSKLLTATVYITDMAQKDAMNEAWHAWIDPEHPSTRACVGVALARPSTLVEIVVSAAK